MSKVRGKGQKPVKFISLKEWRDHYELIMREGEVYEEQEDNSGALEKNAAQEALKEARKRLEQAEGAGRRA